MVINTANNGRSLLRNLNIRLNDFTVLTGANGSGKTQLLQYLHENREVYDQEPIWHEESDQYVGEDGQGLVTLNVIQDDNGKGITNTVYVAPGFKLPEYDRQNIPTTSTVMQNFWSQWQVYSEVVRVAEFLPDYNEDPDQCAAELNRRLSEFSKRVHPEKPGYNYPDQKLIMPVAIRAVFELAKKSGKNIKQLTYSDFVMFQEVQSNWFSPSLDLLFHQYHLRKDNANFDTEIDPLLVFNEILSEMNFRFKAKYTYSGYPEHVSQVILVDQHGSNLLFDSLSSGEQTILSLIFVLYHNKQGGEFPELLLLDEPDAHLHPSLTNTFLNVIQNTFVEGHNVKVILTTHSPTTVALAPEDSLYVMNRITRKPEPIDAETAIAELTDGIVLVTKKTKYVLVEDEDDRDFYTPIFQELVKKNMLNKETPLLFVPSSTKSKSGGKEAVRNWVEKQKQLSLPSLISGLIDEDDGNSSSFGVHVLNRYSIENYLIDPINIYCVLLDAEIAPSINGIDISVGEEYKILNLESSDLQKIANTILTLYADDVPAHFEDWNPESDNLLMSVTFQNEKQVKYPRWLLKRRGKTILNQPINKKFKGTIVNHRSLLKAIKKLKLYPMDLVDKLKEISES